MFVVDIACVRERSDECFIPKTFVFSSDVGENSSKPTWKLEKPLTGGATTGNGGGACRGSGGTGGACLGGGGGMDAKSGAGIEPLGGATDEVFWKVNPASC